MEEEKKKKLEKKLTIGFQIFALIGLVIIGFYLGKSLKANKDNDNKKETNEVIKDFGTKFEQFDIGSNDDKITVQFDGKSVTIENKDQAVYINNKKTDIRYAMSGYILDKVLILYNAGQNGLYLNFFNTDLEEIKFDEQEWIYTKLNLVNGKIEANVENNRYTMEMSCNRINSLYVCDCGELDNDNKLINYKDKIEPLKGEILTAKVELSYDGKNINTTYISKETIQDRYGSDLEGYTSQYCISNNN